MKNGFLFAFITSMFVSASLTLTGYVITKMLCFPGIEMEEAHNNKAMASKERQQESSLILAQA